MTITNNRLVMDGGVFDATSAGGAGGSVDLEARGVTGTETNSKSSIVCARSRSTISKSSFLRSVIGRSFLSVTTTSTRT